MASCSSPGWPGPRRISSADPARSSAAATVEPRTPRRWGKAADAEAAARFDIGQHLGEVGAGGEQRCSPSCPGRREVAGMEAQGDEGGKEAEADQVGQDAGRRRLEARVVDRRQPDADQVHGPGGKPVGQRERHAGHQRDDRGDPDAAGGHQPGGERLVGAAGAAVQVAVEVVVRPTDEELPGENGRHRPDGPPATTGGEGEHAHGGSDRKDRFGVRAAEQVPGGLERQIVVSLSPSPPCGEGRVGMFGGLHAPPPFPPRRAGRVSLERRGGCSLCGA